MKKFSAFIFDLDGTLVDSRHDYSALRKSLGLKEDEAILETIQHWSSEKQQKAHEIIARFEQYGAEVSTPIQDAFDFLNQLDKQKKPKALFTRNSKHMTHLTLKKHQLSFSKVVTRDDHPAKPSPVGLIEIARFLNLPCHEILYVGDYHFDLKAGLAAKMPTALYCKVTPDYCTKGAFMQFSHYSELERFI